MFNKGYIIRSASDIQKSPLNLSTFATTVLIWENLNENKRQKEGSYYTQLHAFRSFYPA